MQAHNYYIPLAIILIGVAFTCQDYGLVVSFISIMLKHFKKQWICIIFALVPDKNINGNLITSIRNTQCNHIIYYLSSTTTYLKRELQLLIPVQGKDWRALPSDNQYTSSWVKSRRNTRCDSYVLLGKPFLWRQNSQE